MSAELDFRPSPSTFSLIHPYHTHTMISDTTLTNLANGLGVAAMACIVLYHFVAVNGKRMEQSQ